VVLNSSTFSENGKKIRAKVRSLGKRARGAARLSFISPFGMSFARRDHDPNGVGQKTIPTSGMVCCVTLSCIDIASFHTGNTNLEGYLGVNTRSDKDF
jgi:hypothetical protein